MSSEYRFTTNLIHFGSAPQLQNGFVNPPIYRGSTVLYSTVSEMEALGEDPLRQNSPSYGRFGTPASRAFEAAMAKFENGYGSVTTNCGLSANTTALMSFTKAGDHVLVSDSVYIPTKMFCLETLTIFGVEVEFYDPAIGSDIDDKIKDNTKLIFMESPSSPLFEIQDVPAICKVAKKYGVVTVLDNTWSTPLFFKAIKHGVDVSIHAATKYITGHSDSLLGVIVCCDEAVYAAVRITAIRLGQCASPDDIYMATRGLRTLSVRLQHHQSQAMVLCEWLQEQPQVKSVYYPPLRSHPGHDLFERDFEGACGLLSIVMQPYEKCRIHEMIDQLKLFGIGHSWGGFESLIVPAYPKYLRKYLDWNEEGEVLRIHVGLEDIKDLIADLAQGFTLLGHPAEV
jgi:cystathionine beta-lyase